MNKSPGKTAVIGAGSWGTALALMLSKKGESVCLWGHRSDHVTNLKNNSQNNQHLPGHHFPENLTVTEHLQEAVSKADTICMVVPSHVFRTVFYRIARLITSETIFVSASKGIENESLRTMTEVMDESLKEVFGKESPHKIAVLSGPSFAREVAEEVPTAVTIGCSDVSAAHSLQHLFSTHYFRAYTSDDVVGLEVSAALKNIVAIAAGICDGLDFGSNARAALITRGLAEITRFGTELGAQEKTFYGLSGLGDLVLTCTGALSRNRQVGLQLGQGKRLEEILAKMTMVAEGVKTTRSVYQLNESLRINMPILDQVYNILYESKDCRTAVKDLLDRDLKPE